MRTSTENIYPHGKAPRMANYSASTQCGNCAVYGHAKAAGEACTGNQEGKHYWNAIRCLDNRTDDEGTPCGGEFPEYRFGYGIAGSYVRCGDHHASYLARAEKVRSRYPDSPVPPAGFDPGYAGERWNDD